MSERSPSTYEETMRNRLVKLQQAKGVCEVCGKRGVRIHYKDGSSFNQTLENLIVLCHCCFYATDYLATRQTSKYIYLYGMTLEEMGDLVGASSQTVKKWLNDPKRRSALLEQLGLEEGEPQ